MKLKTISTTAIAAIATLFSAFGLYTIISVAVSNPLAIIEYREKQIIGLCLCAAALVAATRHLNSPVSRIARTYALVVGWFTFTTKLFLCFMSEDWDIAGWHWIATWAGALLILFVGKYERDI